MRKLMSGVYATALAAILALTTSLPLNAAPIFLPKMEGAQSDVIQVRDGVRWRRNWNGNNFRRGGNYGRYYGHRGYRNYYNGYGNGWYGGGALIAGAIIGGAIANSGYYGSSYYGNGYYGDGYYGNGYGNRYYQRRVYAPGNSYRQGYADGYRAGVNDAGGGISCSPRLADAGNC